MPAYTSPSTNKYPPLNCNSPSQSLYGVNSSGQLSSVRNAQTPLCIGRGRLGGGRGGGIGIAEVVAVLRGKFLADLAADGGFLMTNPFRVFDLDFVLKKNKMSKESSSLRGENRNPKCLSLAPQAE